MARAVETAAWLVPRELARRLTVRPRVWLQDMCGANEGVHRAMPARRGLHGPAEGLPEQQRPVVPGLVSGSRQQKPVHRPPVDASRWLAVW